MTLGDSALALAEACGFDPEWTGDDVEGALDFAKQLMVVMSDIANNFSDDPGQCAAITLFAVAGMVSDMYAIAADAGLCAVEDVPPHPMRALPQLTTENQSMNRAQRRQMDRDMSRHMPPRTPLIVPPGFKARGAT